MKPSQDNYPIFEANQVLTNSHLNQIFDYLDEQERLTRANLIGIGIVCGLEIHLDLQTATLHLGKGVGVTSQGYLMVEPDDVALVSYRSYTPPTDPQYAPFLDNATPFALWELFPAGEPNSTPLASPADFLNDKAVLLFLELKKEGLRNCSLNNCDDRGAEIVVTLRRLLIGVADLKTIMTNANALQGTLTFADLEGALLERLNLPDLRLPRVDVPNTGPATSHDVLAAFLAAFQSEQLAVNTGAALSAAYDAFRPLLQEEYPANPFAGFLQNFGFLDDVPGTTTQVRFLQYYYDLFDDLLQAYEEFRRRGVALLCVCCPPDGLFPRHLMLGVPLPQNVPNPDIYRQPFLAAPIVSGCEERTREVEQLFARLVEMANRFTNTPPPTAQTNIGGSRQDSDIRITPSRLGGAPLSEKAIPYYYLENGTPPLYQLWNPEKSRLNRANQNLSYRCSEYQPPAPPFIANPLRYDLEPYNFLRIEGHLGKNYQTVLGTLLSLRSRYRLPIDIVALQTGPFDENVPVDLSKESCRFQDLEALYDTLKGESVCLWCKEVQYFYSLPAEVNSVTTPTKPLLPLLLQCAPDFLVQPRTMGRVFEDYLGSQPGNAVPDIDPNVIINFLNFLNLGQSNIILFYVVIYISKLFEQLSADLQDFDFASFEKRYQDLLLVTEAVEREREQAVGGVEGNTNLLNWEELDDRLEELIYHCRLDAFRAVHNEYASRVREVKQKLFLSFFLSQHHGIQHKAGVPLGGTFVVVYHHQPAPKLNLPADIITNVREFAAKSGRSRFAGLGIDPGAIMGAFTRISGKKELAVDPDIRVLLGAFTGQAPDFDVHLPPRSEADDIIDAAVKELVEGTVIADFYLPYLCCSDCSPIQFVLPKAPPTFALQVGCSNPNNQAEVTVTPEGGAAPYSVKVDDQDYQPITGVVVLSAGAHTLRVRDQEGAESALQSVTIAQQLTLGTPSYDCIAGENAYVATFQINGGSAPYTASRGTVTGNIYSSDALPGDADIEIVITDGNKCTASQTVRNSCIPQLAFTAKLGCTTANNVAPADIAATGGSAPYRVQVDTADSVPIAGPFQLTVGSHTLTVHDAANGVTPPQTFVVPPPLALSESDFTCEGSASYRSFIRINGGTPPYTANGKPVVGNQFVSDPIASGAKLSVAVTDQHNCTATLEVQHNCEQPCLLPCGGQSRRCAYRLWIQPSSGDLRYKSYQQDANAKFRFNGAGIDLNTGNIPVMQVQQLNANFQDAIGQYIKALNEAINQALIAKFGATSANRLVISYHPAESDPFGILLIEYFVCETFDVEFRYSFAMPDPVFTLTVRYSNEPSPSGAPFDGMIVTNLRLNNKEMRVPAFDCSERNQCSGSDYAALCQGARPRPSFSVQAVGDNQFRFDGKVDDVAESEVTAWVWDFLTAHASEPFFQGQTIQLQLQPPPGQVRLTAITRKGCFGIGSEI